MRILKGALLALLVGVGACDDGVSGNDMARVSVRLTDAPGDLATAEVEIREIYLQGENGDSGRVSLFTGSRKLDLLTLQNGVTAELANVTVPAGSYSQLRLVVGEATITTAAGKTYSTTNGTLVCPSCAQSGLKIKLPGGAVRLDNDSQILVIDFDVAQSFGHQAGRSGKWVMHPVLAATKLDTSGGISGTVALADSVTLPTCGGSQVGLNKFVPTVTAGDVTLSGTTATDGKIRFAIVAPGTYTPGFADKVTFDNGETLTFAATPSVSSVTVGSGATATLNYTITAATCAASQGSGS